LVVVLIGIGLLTGKDDGSHDKASPAHTTDAAGMAPAPTPATIANDAPQSESASDLAPTTKNAADPREAAQAYYLAVDDLAVHLDTAVNDAMHGRSGSLARIKRLRAQVINKVNARALASDNAGIGGNLLLSAATDAREAAIDEDPQRLAAARNDVLDARNKLAKEATE
jgi:hypothetical protein